MSCKDHSISGEVFRIDQCLHCGLKFTNPRPEGQQLAKYYESPEYISHSDSSEGLTNNIYKIARTFALRSKTSLLNKYQPIGKILDIGCGTGHFLKACQTLGWQITGMEPNASARKKAQEITKTNIYSQLNQLETNSKYDVITLWHVLEHLESLDDLASVQKHLDESGTLVIALPNHQSWDAKHYEKNWAGYDLPRHLYHFDRQSITSLLERYAFKLDHIHPMKLDAFYVSLLSEKYKNPSILNFPNALIKGLISNLKAGTDNYSSLIYIFSK